jgi:hypothetical protein
MLIASNAGASAEVAIGIKGIDASAFPINQADWWH